MGQVIGSEQGVPEQSEQRDIRSWLALAMQSPVRVTHVQSVPATSPTSVTAA